jgi:hypothetical protein
MKVKELLEQLEAYEPDTELIVAYWDKATVEGYQNGLFITDEQWSDVVETYENGEWHFQGSAAEDFVEIAQQVVSDEG